MFIALLVLCFLSFTGHACRVRLTNTAEDTSPILNVLAKSTQPLSIRRAGEVVGLQELSALLLALRPVAAWQAPGTVLGLSTKNPRSSARSLSRRTGVAPMRDGSNLRGIYVPLRFGDLSMELENGEDSAQEPLQEVEVDPAASSEEKSKKKRKKGKTTKVKSSEKEQESAIAAEEYTTVISTGKEEQSATAAGNKTAEISRDKESESANVTTDVVQLAATSEPESLAESEPELVEEVESEGSPVATSEPESSEESEPELAEEAKLEGSPVKEELKSTITDGLGSTKPNKALIAEILLKLERHNPTTSPADSTLINGKWKFLYASGLSPALRGLQLLLRGSALAPKSPSGADIVDVAESYLTISPDQPRGMAEVKFRVLSLESTARLASKLEVQSAVRIQETYDFANLEYMDMKLPLPQLPLPGLQNFKRSILITYLDDDLMVVRDAMGRPDVLVRAD